MENKKSNMLENFKLSGTSKVSTKQIKEFDISDTKFDCTGDLPQVFVKNKLAVLPVSQENYEIAHFDAYHPFEKDDNTPVCQVSLPPYIESFTCIANKKAALNCLLAAGIFSDFLEENKILPVLSGRIGSGSFHFRIDSSIGETPRSVEVDHLPIEIDAVYEGMNSLTLVQSKFDSADDFFVKQLYYPYRFLQGQKKITKTIRPVFLTYADEIYRLYEYQFTELDNYNSLSLVKQKKYSIKDITVSIDDFNDFSDI